MKKTVFKVGDRVGYAMAEYYEDEYSSPKLVPYFINDYGEDPSYGVVTDVLSSGKIMVQWDDNYMDNDEPQDPKDFMLEDELKAHITSLEADFKETSKEIKAKMKEAATIIKEAHKLAKKTGNKLSDMYESVRPLVDAMDNSGWRSSSWGC